VLRTLGARERRMIGGRRPQAVWEAGEAEAVPTVRATLIGVGPLEDGDAWLDALRGDSRGRETLVSEALSELNALLRAHRAAAADPYAHEIARWHANVVRIGYGSGEKVADGRFDAAYVVPEPAARGRADGLAPQERLAAILSGSDHLLAAEELVLRARLDLDSGRPREAALQARIALEALLAELPEASALASYREAVGAAANAALAGDPPIEGVTDAVEAMRAALAHHARRSL
jgi:hypothetical protein